MSETPKTPGLIDANALQLDESRAGIAKNQDGGNIGEIRRPIQNRSGYARNLIAGTLGALSVLSATPAFAEEKHEHAGDKDDHHSWGYEAKLENEIGISSHVPFSTLPTFAAIAPWHAGKVHPIFTLGLELGSQSTKVIKEEGAAAENGEYVRGFRTGLWGMVGGNMHLSDKLAVEGLVGGGPVAVSYPKLGEKGIEGNNWAIIPGVKGELAFDWHLTDKAFLTAGVGCEVGFNAVHEVTPTEVVRGPHVLCSAMFGAGYSFGHESHK